MKLSERVAAYALAFDGRDCRHGEMKDLAREVQLLEAVEEAAGYVLMPNYPWAMSGLAEALSRLGNARGDK